MAGTDDDRLVRAALASARIPNLVAHGTRAVLNGLWLGVLSDERLRAVDERYYAGQSMYRTEEWNGRGLFPWEEDAVRDHFPEGGRVAVVGSGGGREVLALRRKGFDAIGYESHPDLVAYADDLLARHGFAGAIHATDRDRFGAPPASCDAAIVGWGTYSLVHGRDTRNRLLREARDALVAPGPVLLSCFERPAGNRTARWVKTLADPLRRLRGAPPLELGDVLAPNLVHVFTEDELRDEADAAGFDVAEHRVVAEADAGIVYACAVLRARP